MNATPFFTGKPNTAPRFDSGFKPKRGDGEIRSCLARSVWGRMSWVLLCFVFAGSDARAQNPVLKSTNSVALPVDPAAPWPEAEKKGLWPAAGTPPTETPPAEKSDDFRQVPKINGIVIVRSLKEFNPDGIPLKPGLTVTSSPLLETPQFARLADKFLNQPMSEARMRELQREIILYYRKHDRPLVDVLYPEQDVSNGMLQVIAIEGRLKEVKVQDAKGNPYTNGWSGLTFLRNSIQLRTNDVIAESVLVKDLDWLNRNPFREVEAIYEPDRREYGMSSVLLRVDEQRQWSADIGYEDSGSDVTSENRIIFGGTWGKAFGLKDNVFRYAFTADPSFQLLRVNSASYYLPLPWRHGLRLSGYYLNVTSDPGSGATLSGIAYQASMRYEVPLSSIGKFQHEAALGLDFKYNENNLFFGGIQQFNTPTEIFQIAANYSAVLPDRLGRTSFSAQGYYSPGNVTDLNTDTAFDASRPEAQAEYVYGRFALERLTHLPGNFYWILRGSGQIANGNLLASEQLGMGGYATVRGYEEREGNADNDGDQGYFFSTELRTPPLSLVRLFRKTAALHDELQFLCFYDYGYVMAMQPISGQDPSVQMSSVGVGLRYTLARNFSLRFDYGWQLESTGLGPAGQDSRAHIGVVATY
jgi:hemolysin activation/secretion protein